MTSRINVLRPLNPGGLYPVFDLQVSVKGAEYDLVLPDLVADQLRAYCCRREHYRLEREHDGDTLRGIRSGVVRRTVSPADRHRLLYAELETKAEVRVHVDKLPFRLRHRDALTWHEHGAETGRPHAREKQGTCCVRSTRQVRPKAII